MQPIKLKLYIKDVEVVYEILWQKFNLNMFSYLAQHCMYHAFRLTVATSGEC